MHPEDIQLAIERTHDRNPKVRRKALLSLCPCHVRHNVDVVWDRLFEMQNDEDRGVRSIVLHNLTDGSPKARQEEVVEAIETLANDPDKMLRRRARRALSHFRKTGNIIEA